MDDEPRTQSHPTNFDLCRPCRHCPYTRTAPGYLSEERAQEISNALLFGGTSFACHETLDYETLDDDCEIGDDDPGITTTSQWCAGALMLYEKLEGTR